MLAPIHVPAADTKQFTGPRRGADRQREDRPVPVRVHLREQRHPQLVRHRPDTPLGRPRVVPDPTLRVERLQGIVMRVLAPAVHTIARHRVDQRPLTQVDPVPVELTFRTSRAQYGSPPSWGGLDTGVVASWHAEQVEDLLL